ncbi:aldehyde ferredoxin oxidoreductase family protein [Desulforhopalus singaporensis]|uniref:Aldehyde:ferredoxin oxidoreductase n=1 Tax=Desulforhopalus singaporensis TaxID=91360 RepID=A0A1H0SJH4_9BACT|nr:aldehyde ferredoxin oxidoreductase family protein [Desulforhopalus singaporensis]SDP41860.1 aldehyde:ferredoxin oxidoreductase [Desulforhopalus singaporensis]
MNGANGKLIEVDLTRGEIRVEGISPSLFREYLGGYGLGVRLLMEKMDPAADPLGPENILGLASGYLSATGAVAADRYMAFGKSPSTGGWGDANSGGKFGRKLKEAGCDAVLFCGQADSPVYLFIDEQKAELRVADFIWGKDCYETENELKKIHGDDCEVACIGVAGERMSMIAGISTDKGRIAARSALGAVMGSKLVKAVVVAGKKKMNVADPEVFKRRRKKTAQSIADSPFGQGLSQRGTSMFYQTCVSVGDAPVKNWSQTGELLKNAESVSEEVMENFREGKYRCSSCVIGCGGHEQVKEGRYRTQTTVHKTEYESMAMTGCNLLNESPDSLVRINDICNRYGMDTIGCGGLCGYAIEAFENGYITMEHTGGLELKWGDPECIVALVEQIGSGEGLGGILQKGFNHAVEVFGRDTERYVMAVRNEALPAHDPRWSAGLALAYYSDATPARHTQGSTTFPVAGYAQPEMTNDNLSGRGKYHRENVNLVHALSCAGICTFCFSIVDYKEYPKILTAVDGIQWTEDEFMKVGQRIAVLRHLFNLKAGINFRKTRFPERVLECPTVSGGDAEGTTIDLQLLVDDYLTELGFDLQTTRPSPEMLDELNIAQFS